MHFYTEETCWPQLAPLAQCLAAQAILLAKSSGSRPFDECLSGVWWQLAERLKAKAINVPLPQGCCSATIELRGELDVSHTLAQADATALLDWLTHVGALHSATPVKIPPALCQATPLAGSETLHAPVPGLVVFAAQIGQWINAGDLVAELIDPIANHSHPVCASVSGIFYARIRDRYITTGGELGKIAGATAFRCGELLGA